jgi:crotonobetainyl-CoA:carnitine CoA-transferase CaiB-like acyl-CoA transferase
MPARNAAPFSGIRIVDFTSYFTGPYATAILADQGAEVIKVEASPNGDLMRQMGTSRDGQAATYESVNHSKRSIALDLKQESAQEVAQRLIARGDVFVENFRPGVAERLGLDYQTIRKLAPDIICVSISGYGNKGPYGRMPTFDSIVQGHSAMAFTQGADERPEYVRQAIVDKVTALYAAQAISAALFARAMGRGGDHVALAMYDAAVSFLWPDSMNEYTFLSGNVRTMPTMSSMYNMQRTKDGYISIAPITNEQFFGLCRALNREDVIGDDRVGSLAKRVENREFVRDVRSSAENFTTEELCVRLLAEDVPHGPVLTREAAIEDPQFAFASVREYGEATKRTRMAVAPATFLNREARKPFEAPKAGQHSREILNELDFSAVEIDALIDSGAVTTPRVFQ